MYKNNFYIVKEGQRTFKPCVKSYCRIITITGPGLMVSNKKK